MTYALVLPLELLKELAVIREITKESIRSFCIASIEDAINASIGAIEAHDSIEVINSIRNELDKRYKR